jgi:hypothetical protein
MDNVNIKILYKSYSYLKITGILNNVFRPQKTLNKTIITQYTGPPSVVIRQRNFDYQSKGCGPALWSSGQRFGLLIMRSRVRFLALPWEFFPDRGGSPW